MLERATGPVLGLAPADVANLPPEALPGLLAALAALQGAIAARLAAAPVHALNGEAAAASDGLLPVEEAARLAGVTVKEFYRRKALRPAVVKLGHRTIRVNERKLHRILAGSGI